MDAIIITIETEIERSDLNINYHKEQLKTYEARKLQLTTELAGLKQLLDEPLPKL